MSGAIASLGVPPIGRAALFYLVLPCSLAHYLFKFSRLVLAVLVLSLNLRKLAEEVWRSRRFHASSALTTLLLSTVDRTDLAPSTLTENVVFGVANSIISRPLRSNLKKPRKRRENRRSRPRNKYVYLESAKNVLWKFMKCLISRCRGGLYKFRR